MIRRFSILLALLALCSLLIVACGDDDDDDAASDDDSAVVTATATEATVSAAEERTEAGDESAPSSESTAESTESFPMPATATTELLPESALVVAPPRDDSIPRDGRVLGDPDAPVSIVEYGDFQ